MVSDRKRIAILGSTGSIGRQTLDVIKQFPDRFEVIALAAGRRTTLLAEQVHNFKPRYVASALMDSTLESSIEAVSAERIPMEELVLAPDVDIVLAGTGGGAGLVPTIEALKVGKPVAIANKEALVMAGHLIRKALQEGNGALYPVDSEHSAIWQCLWGEEDHDIRRILLTASGGAFRDLADEELAAVTPAQALKHPTWNMGDKITVDCATLMNKGMETIEATWLFDVPMERVEVVLHRESIVHSLVEFSDGSVKAQLGVPDMRLPIQCALAYPDRMPKPPAPELDLASAGTLNFGRPDIERFPCLNLAMHAGSEGGTYPAVMAAADEIAVERFLAGEIRFIDIATVIEHVLDEHSKSIQSSDPVLAEVLEVDAWARKKAKSVSIAGSS